MFRGATNISMDTKWRLAIPAKYRDAFIAHGGEVVMTAHPHGCALLYPAPVWEPIEARLNTLSSFDKQSSIIQRLLTGNVEELSLDSAGRILVSESLREFAELDKEVTLVGQGSHFEIWSKQAWRAQMDAIKSGANFEMPPELAGFSL